MVAAHGTHQIYFGAGGVYCEWARSSSHCEVDSMKMRGRGNGNGRSLLLMVWVLAAMGWMGAGVARGQEARSKAELS